MGHKLVFNGIDTSDYGIIISGAGTYATPERDITSLSVPGRNGDIHFDNGRYNNIQVTYECGISKGFESKYLPFMRQMLSAPVYSRLEDDYHLDEFRLGTFRAEMVPDVGTIMRSGKFELVFDCKPQRFLKAGESPRLTLNTTAAETLPIICGIPDSIFNDDTISKIKALGYPTNVEFMFIDTTGYEFGNDYLKVFYSDSFDIFAPNGSLPCIALAGSPLYGESAGAMTYEGKWLDADRSFTRSCSSVYHNVVFPMPINCIIYRNVETNVKEKIFPDSATLSAQSVMECSPLIHMTVSSAVNSPVAVLLNESLIGLNTPATVGDPNDPKTVTNVWIDCDTYDSYTIADGTKYSLNPYVTMTGKFTFDGPITVYSNSSIDQVEIIPRWWRL